MEQTDPIQAYHDVGAALGDIDEAIDVVTPANAHSFPSYRRRQEQEPDVSKIRIKLERYFAGHIPYALEVSVTSL